MAWAPPPSPDTATNEVIWYAERDNWGHLYLYDFKTGALKHRLTSGDGPVLQMVRLDDRTCTVWPRRKTASRVNIRTSVTTCRVGLDGTGGAPLTPVGGDHSVQLSPLGRSLVDTCSQPDVEPAVVLRDGSGTFVMMLEKADVSRMRAMGRHNTIPDQIAGMKQLAEEYPWIDLGREGV